MYLPYYTVFLCLSIWCEEWTSERESERERQRKRGGREICNSKGRNPYYIICAMKKSWIEYRNDIIPAILSVIKYSHIHMAEKPILIRKQISFLNKAKTIILGFRTSFSLQFICHCTYINAEITYNGYERRQQQQQQRTIWHTQKLVHTIFLTSRLKTNTIIL